MNNFIPEQQNDDKSQQDNKHCKQLKEDLSKEGIEKIVKENSEKLTTKQKQLAIKYGFLKLAGLDAAKAELKKNEYNSSIILDLAQRLNLKDQKGGQVNEEEKDGNKMAMKYQDEFNQQVQQALNRCQTDSDRIDILCMFNNQNKDGLVNFVATQQNASSEFLALISDSINREDSHKQKLRIFLSICAVYYYQDLQLNEDLYCPMLQYIATQPPSQVQSLHAISFMRLVFKNTISLVKCEARFLTKFDEKFISNFSQFQNSLQNKYKQQHQIITALPETCLVLSKAMISALKEVKSSLLSEMPFLFFKPVVDLITYTFCDDYATTRAIIKCVVRTGSDHLESVKESQYVSLVEALVIEVKAGNKKWFQQMKAIKDLLVGAMTMVAERKVPKEHNQMFTLSLCKRLITEDDYLLECLANPTNLSQDATEKDCTNYFNLIKIKSSDTKQQLSIMNNFDCNCNVLPEYEEAMQALGIVPKEFQQICLRLLQQHSLLFLNPGAGTGKSTLIIVMAFGLALNTNEQILCVNSDSVLLQRDYDRAVDKALKFTQGQLDVVMLKKGSTSAKEKIVFMTLEQLKLFALPKQFGLLLDEYQVLYGADQLQIASILRKYTTFVGMSGSPSLSQHIKLMLSFIPKAFYIEFPEQLKHNITVKDITLHKTLIQHTTAIAKVVANERIQAPVLLIMDETDAQRYVKQPFRLVGDTVCLFGPEVDEITVNAILNNQFTKQKACKYGVFITNRKGGTGTDYPSNTVINNNGGNRVIICCEPDSYGELEQIKKRTGRMENVGIVYMILNTPPNVEGVDYMNTLIEKLKKKEIEHIRGLQRDLEQLSLGQESNESSNEEMKVKECPVYKVKINGPHGCKGTNLIVNNCLAQHLMVKSCAGNDCALCGKPSDKIYQFDCVDCKFSFCDRCFFQNQGREKSQINNKEQTIQIDASNNISTPKTDQNRDVQMKDEENQNDEQQTMQIDTRSNKEDICINGCKQAVHIGPCIQKAQDQIIIMKEGKKSNIRIIDADVKVIIDEQDLSEFKNLSLQKKGTNMLKKRQQFNNPVELADQQNQQVKKLRSSATPSTFTIAATTATTVNFSSMKAFKGRKQQTVVVNSFGFQNEGKDSNSLTQSDLQSEQSEQLKKSQSQQEEKFLSLSTDGPKDEKRKKRNQKEIEKNEVIEKRQLRLRK